MRTMPKEIKWAGRIEGAAFKYRVSDIYEITGSSRKEIFKKLLEELKKDKNSEFVVQNLENAFELIKKYYRGNLEDENYKEIIDEATKTDLNEFPWGHWFFELDGSKYFLRTFDKKRKIASAFNAESQKHEDFKINENFGK